MPCYNSNPEGCQASKQPFQGDTSLIQTPNLSIMNETADTCTNNPFKIDHHQKWNTNVQHTAIRFAVEFTGTPSDKDC